MPLLKFQGKSSNRRLSPAYPDSSKIIWLLIYELDLMISSLKSWFDLLASQLRLINGKNDKSMIILKYIPRSMRSLRAKINLKTNRLLINSPLQSQKEKMIVIRKKRKRI
jgi:hypothetical protein